MPRRKKKGALQKSVAMLLTRDAAASYTAFIDGGAARDCGGRGWFFSGFPERL
jgi:hypothetical protein